MPSDEYKRDGKNFQKIVTQQWLNCPERNRKADGILWYQKWRSAEQVKSLVALCPCDSKIRVKMWKQSQSAGNNDRDHTPDRDRDSWLALKQVRGHRSWSSWQVHTVAEPALSGDACSRLNTSASSAPLYIRRGDLCLTVPRRNSSFKSCGHNNNTVTS